MVTIMRPLCGLACLCLLSQAAPTETGFASAVGDQQTETTPASKEEQRAQVQSGARTDPATSTPKNATAETDVSRRTSARDVDEKATLKFVSKHHPRLLELMSFLKKRQPAQFQQALRETSRTMQRLEGLQQRDPELHDVELGLWQTKCDLRLVAAQLSIASTERELGRASNKLRELVDQEIALGLDKLKIQHQRARQHAQELGLQLSKHQASAENRAERALKSWENRIARQSSARAEKSTQKPVPSKDAN